MKHTDLQKILLEMAQPIDDVLNPDRRSGRLGARKVGFLLCAFEFDPGDAFAYLSNAQPDQLKSALKELVERLGATARIVERGRPWTGDGSCPPGFFCVHEPKCPGCE